MSFLKNKGGGGDDSGNGAQADGMNDRETAQELESLLGKVSSYEGRLEGLLGMPVNAEG